jgi:glycosyltransferase involved in cell wall biosynthesis
VPDVSVIIPTRDRYDYLRLTLRSALRQRDVDLEVIVVDDGSADATARKVLDLRSDRVRVLRNAVSLGESGARNRGIEASAGRWIAFLDDDDLWAPDKLACQLEEINRTGAGWAYAGDVVVDDDLNVLHGTPPPPPEQVLRDLRRHNAVPSGASNVLVEASMLSRVGPFDVDLRRTADWDMWLRLARVGSPAGVSRPLVANRVHPGNVSREMGSMMGELDVIAARYGIPVDRPRHYRWAAWVSLLEGRRTDAVRCYVRAATAGDLRSIGRAVVAIVDQRYAARAADRTVRASEETGWVDEARTWLAALSAPGER